MNTLARGLLIVLGWACVSMSSHAAELPDPAASLSPRDLIAALAALRQPYAEHPTDVDVTGRILLSYVGLCLSGSVRELACFGPWLDYARVIVKERQAARGGKPPQSWAEAKPELWVTWLGGDAVATLAGLDAWPEAAKDPLGRALRAYASGERGELTTDDGPWARMALLWLNDPSATDHVDPRLDALQVQLALREHRHWPDHLDLPVRQWVADVAWLLRSRDLDDAVALPRLRALALALGASQPEPVRADLIRQIEDAARHAPVLDATVFSSCLEALDIVLTAQGKTGSETSPRTLVGAIDVAHWLADRSARVLWLAMAAQNWSEPAMQQLAQPLAARCPDWPMMARLAMGRNPAAGTVADHQRLAAILQAELRQPRRISPRRAALFLNVLSDGPCAEMVPALLALLDQRLAPDEPAVLDWLSEGLAPLRMLPLLRSRLDYAATHGHRDVGAVWYGGRLRAGPLLDLAGMKPLAAWIDTQVDQTTLPWPHLGVSEYLAVVWQGWLKVEKPGIYRLGCESDDGSRLSIDDGLTVTNGGSHAMERRHGWFPLCAGWHALTLEFEQGAGGAGCRLLWCPPGEKNLSVIPAPALTHGDDHQPGLAAAGYHFHDQTTYAAARSWHPAPILRAHLASDPGFFRLHVEFCRRALLHGHTGLALDSARILGVLAKAGQPPFAPGFASGISAEVALMALLAEDQEDPALIRALVPYLESLNDISMGAMEQDEDLLHDARRFWFDASQEQRSWLLIRLLHYGCAADLAANLRASGATNPTEQVMLGACALELGDLASAQHNLAAAMSDHLNLASNNLPRRILEWAMLERLPGGHDPEWQAVLAALAKHHATPDQLLAARWLSGELPWAEAQNEIPQTADGDCLNYYRAIYELSLGQYDAANTRFTAMIAQHPDWLESDTARHLTAWITTLTPENRAALPKAKPLASDTAAPAPSNF